MKHKRNNLHHNVRAIKKEVRQLRAEIERNNRIDELIAQMKQAAREMLLMSREL